MAPTERDHRFIGAIFIIVGSIVLGWGVKSDDFLVGGPLFGIGLAVVILGVLRSVRK